MGQQQVLIVLIVTIIVGILTVVAINELGKNQDNQNPYQAQQMSEVQSRSTIKEVESGRPFGTHVEIFEAKGHEYVSTWKGGLVHSASCQGDHDEVDN